jgi:hypothetical protein
LRLLGGNTLGGPEVEEKLEVRHAGGVYYTPRFVVDTIIRRVVGPKIAGKTPMQVMDVKILDPACGSGSFLVAAFKYLLDHCLNAVSADPRLASIPATPRARKKRKDIAFKDNKGNWHLAPDFRAALLTSCIHGVDIDQQAMEVTVMSLYLKMLEEKLPLNWQRDWIENQLLPPLENNIRCGNSLIDSADFDRYVEETQGGLFPADEDIRFRMNRFDWESRMRGFGRYLDPQAEHERGRRGFDCIIGNPPYIRVQELNKWAPEECEFYKFRYDSAKKGNYDIYVVFTERCLELLAPDGLLGFIMPHKFWQAQYGEGLRKILTDGRHLRSIIDFGAEQVFAGATTYTAVHVLGKELKMGEVDYVKIHELQDGRAQCGTLDAGLKTEGTTRFRARQPESTDTWVFNSARVSKWLDSIRGEPLSEVADLAQGFKTGADDVFVVELIEDQDQDQDEYTLVGSNATGNVHKIETACLRPLVKSEHMKAFEILPTGLAVVFPYTCEPDGWRLYTTREMKSQFPLLWRDYLVPLRKTLANREEGRWDGEEFYKYSRPQNFAVLTSPKIMNPDICEHLQMCWDEGGRYVFSGGAAGGVAIVADEKKVSSLFLLGVLNSYLAERWIRAKGTPFRGGYLNCEIRFIRDFPIRLPQNAHQEMQANRIAESARNIIEIKKKLVAATTSQRERGSLETEIESDLRRINEAVFRLYGVDGLPD